MDFLFSGILGEWIEAVLAIVGAASAVAAATPTKKDDNIIGTISRVIDVIALNVGHAKRQ
ncbi:hypothetical protein [Parvibaculum sp.]|uniref:hypothetical protein n=1 Tax=Parvibaculum sp. TaxID=2024848 RepID=UPI0027318E8E|nr:hypothetical protein [Parvibaculum sp.]MDP1627517.1 hypothetical protein [Parvibaculum sp.]MDP2148696.1 hypothetical protein [Parvibaculum sp.]MDP3326722.1 hypothetical protein [Parvibaculum sp.]